MVTQPQIPQVSPIQNAPGAQTAGFSTLNPETVVSLPWCITPASSWLDYRCWAEVILDPGMVLHKTLPQVNYPVDTLAQIDCQNQNLDNYAVAGNNLTSGVNINSNSQATDIIQRMATSTYLFILRGYGLRAGYQIPIPGILKIGGLTPCPVYPQRAVNMMVGNYGGVPIFQAAWELHYVVNVSPTGPNAVPPIPYDPALHIRPDVYLPQGINVPIAFPDQAHASGAPSPGNLTGGGTSFTTTFSIVPPGV